MNTRVPTGNVNKTIRTRIPWQIANFLLTNEIIVGNRSKKICRLRPLILALTSRLQLWSVVMRTWVANRRAYTKKSASVTVRPTTVCYISGALVEILRFSKLPNDYWQTARVNPWPNRHSCLGFFIVLFWPIKKRNLRAGPWTGK